MRFYIGGITSSRITDEGVIHYSKMLIFTEISLEIGKIAASPAPTYLE